MIDGIWMGMGAAYQGEKPVIIEPMDVGPKVQMFWLGLMRWRYRFAFAWMALWGFHPVFVTKEEK